jgi:3-dehydroquinate dehydratase-2
VLAANFLIPPFYKTVVYEDYPYYFSTMKIMVIHGPNIPLMGKVSISAGTRLTLDKVNKALRKRAFELDLELKIFQLYSEENILKTICRRRNEISGIIISLGALSQTAYNLRELLAILRIPTVEVYVKEFPFSEENFTQSVLKDIVKNRFWGNGVEPYLNGLNAFI